MTLRHQSTIKTFIILLTSAILIYFFVSNCIKVKFVQDDAYITFRYVKNFLAGNGLVFNLHDRVEGYTSLLWIFTLSFTSLLHFDIISSAQNLSIFFGILNLFVVYLITFHNISKLNAHLLKKQTAFLSFVPSFMLAFTPGYIYWSVSGMETTQFIFLILTGTYFYLIQSDTKGIRLGFVIVFVFAIFSRPEGIFYFFVIYLFDVITSYKNSNPKFILKRSVIEILIVVIPLLLYTFFRLYYYGYPLPNTFYAKSGFELYYLKRGLNYFSIFINSYLLSGLVFVLILPVLLDKKNRNINYFLISIFVCAACAVVIIGGDVLPLHRFFLPVLPLMYILLLNSFVVLADYIYLHITKVIAYSSIYLFVMLLTALTVYNYKSEYNPMMTWRGYEIGLVEKMKIYANWIKEKQKKENKTFTVALSTIGAFSYYSGARIIDIVGLTNRYIAHHQKETPGIAENVSVLWKERKYNAEYVISVKPDFILFPAGANPTAFPEAAIFSRNEFKYYYYPELLYSYDFDQYLPIYSLKNKIQLEDSNKEILACKCGAAYVGNFIKANNLFTEYLKTPSDKLKTLITNECLELIKNCPEKRDYGFMILGYFNYHAGNLNLAADYLQNALEIDKFNSISYAYLKTIYSQTGNKKLAEYYYNRLIEYSSNIGN